MGLISVVIPVYNEEESLPLLYERLVNLTCLIPQYEAEFIFVDDGSRDKTLSWLTARRAQDRRIKVVSLSRNFGSHAAMRAGLTCAGGDAVANISGDLQDPPELIAQMIEKWQQGADIVWGVRAGRDESAGYQWFAGLYYFLMRKLALKEMPAGGMDLCLMDRRVLQTLLTIPEKNTTIFGLVLWMGYKQVFLPYRREARRFGSTKWSLDKKIKMVIDSLTSFSVAPIRIWSYLGSGLFLLASVGSILSLGAWVAQAAWAWIGLALFIILGVLGLQLVAIGVIGEYVWRTLDESRPRPSYIIRERIGFDSDKSDGEVSPP